MKRVPALLCVVLCVLATGAQAQSAQINNVRIWAAPDSTRVVFDVSGPVEHELEVLSDPFRAVIDIADARFAGPLSQPTVQDKYLQRLRSGEHDEHLRVVLDLKKFSQVKTFQLLPNQRYGHRLVVDIFDTQAELEAKQAQVAAMDDEAPLSAMREVVVAIDAGHGGEDPGARGPSGVYEKVIVLDVARRLARLIEQERGMRAVLIREGDYFLSLRGRIEKARRNRADLFISIHADSFRDPRVRGSSVFVLSQRGASSEHARWLAEQENASDLVGGVSLDVNDDVLKSVLLDLSQTASLEASIDVAERVLGSLKRVGKLHKPRVESAAFAVLKSPDIPSILVETAYISNPDEEKNLRSDSYQNKLASALLEGLRGYFRQYAPEGTLLAQRRHVIARGDTLSGIAQFYRVSLQSLRDMNGLKTDSIQVGSTLTIPGGSGG